MLEYSLPLNNAYANRSLVDYTNDLLTFIHSSEFFQTFAFGFHILDFFTEDLYDLKIPEEWRKCFSSETFEFENFLECVVRDNGNAEVLPKSLTDLLRKIRRLSFNRECVIEVPLPEKRRKLAQSPKKIHETDRLACLISEKCETWRISQVVDFGSGNGTLSRDLAFDYGLNVMALERRQHLITLSEKLDQQHLQQVRPSRPGKLRHVQKDITSGDLGDIVTDEESCIAVGIHTCGDLSKHALSAMLHKQFDGLVIVGCCYNNMTMFPYSKTFANVELTMSAKNLACQAPQNWTKESSDEFFKRHFFRALLQKLLLDLGQLTSHKRMLVGSLRPRYFANFAIYVEAAMEKLHLPPLLISEAVKLASKYEHEYVPQFKSLKITWTLICACAPLLETCILLDRFYYLYEQNCMAEINLTCVFDQSISPRNVAIVGRKNS